MFLKPSIEFCGQAEEALNFYKEIFNGEVDHLFRYGEEPGNPQSKNLDKKHKQMLVNARVYG